MEWWERLQLWMDEKPISRRALAERADIGIERLNKWLQGKVPDPRSGALDRVLNVLDRSEQELFYGISDAQLAQLRRFPLIDFTNMGRLRRGDSPQTVWDSETTTEGHSDVSNEAFGVRLTDDSCSFDGFHSGDVVIVDPTLPWHPRDFVIAVREDLGQAVFGRFSPAPEGAPYPFQVIPTDRHYPAVNFDEGRPGFIVGRATKHIRDI
jgi:transcriptional regulator with XRE-family HTH domain